MPLNAKDESSVKNPLAANAAFYPTITSDVLNIQTSETNYVVNLYNQRWSVNRKIQQPNQY